MDYTTKISQNFSASLVKSLSKEQINNVKSLNKACKNEGMCASNLYTNTIVFLMKSFSHVLNRDYNFNSTQDFMIINTALEIAKQNEFFI